jgi:hypothetical protein
MLQRGTHGQLAFQLCLFVFTEQPQLLSINTKHLAARVLLLGEVLGLPVPDVAELLVRCPALLDVLPLRCAAAVLSFHPSFVGALCCLCCGVLC